MTRRAKKLAPPAIRQLPVAIPPVLRETVASYTRRLAAANHVQTIDLYEAWGIRPFGYVERHLTSDQLAKASGYPAWKLEAALPELTKRRPRDWVSYDCPRCSQRLSSGPMHRFYPSDRPFCVPHRMWLGYAGAVDVSLVAAIRSASRRHRRLIAGFGAKDTDAAFSLARSIHYGEEDNFVYGERAEILDLLRPGKDRIPLHDPALAAASYPRLVRTCGFLLSPYWRRMAQTEKGQQRFFPEFGKHCLGIPDYQPEDPSAIGDWVAREAAKFRTRQVAQPPAATESRLT